MRIKHPSLPHSLASFFLSISVFIFAFFLLPSSFFLRPTLAQIPDPYVDCDDVDDPEFHSLRPYQASPCNQNKENQAIFCGNELTLTDLIQASVSNPAFSSNCTEVGTDQYSCSFSISVSKNFAIDLSEAEFPILGNTELVRNSRRAEDEIDNAQRLNEYVSWYLNGAVYKPENPPVDTETREGRDALINFSGPVRKLLPQSILFASQKNSVEKRDEERHNQIVVCAQESFLWFFGKTTPHECYEGHDKDATPDVYRLNAWDGPLSYWNTVINFLVNLFTAILPDVPREMIEKSIGDHWNKRTPPLEWADENDEPFKSSALYLKAYNEWRGKTCVLLPFLPSPICIDNPFVRNKWSELFAYVPLVSTEDRLGEVYVDQNSVSAPADVTLTNVSVKSDPADLFFAHVQETKEIAPLLQSTYLPQGADGAEGITTTSVDSTSCKFADVRANPGDDLFADEIKVDLSYTASFSCTFGEGGGTCERPVSVFLKTLTATPEADEIWARLVNGTASIFKRIFPKIGPGGPIEAIEDIPAATKVTFSGDAEGAGELYFPHIGGVYEYFLQCTQSLLRPKGFGGACVSGISQEAEPPDEDACGGEFLENLPKAGGSCALGGISSRVGSIPQTLKDIVEAAAETYKTPPNLILAAMYGEGAFNQPPYQKYDWTEENVKAWATCTPVPGCSTSGDDNFLGFNSSIWPGIASRIEPDIKKLNPNRGTPSQCNLLDAIYGLAWNLHDSADGGMSFSCFGIDLNAPVPTSCSWNDNQYESAIKVHESGYTNLCFTKEDSCATGGGLDAACPTGGDTCETKTNRYAKTSHNGCVWDVAHGK